MKHAPLLLAFVLTSIQSTRVDEPLDPAELQRAREHYVAVEAELRARDVSELPAAQRAARAALIATLGAYRLRGDFTRNTDFPGARVPYFVDHDGRLCAVANLLHATGEDELVRRVAATNNHAWVSELAGDESFADWLERVGLSLAEVARIQGPGGDPRPDPPKPRDTPYRPGDAPPSPAGSGRTLPASAGAGPLTGPAGSPGAGATLTRQGAPLTGDDGLEDWVRWWERNKLRWFEPGLRASVAASGEGTEGEGREARLRRECAPRLRAELSHPQPEVRSSAAFAYARASGGASVPELEALFADANQDVRESAILALGASGSEAGVHALLTLLRVEQPPTPRAKALAIVALGVARLNGVGAGVEGILAQLLPGLEREGGDDILHATLLFQDLAPTNELAARVRCATGRFREDCTHAEARLETRARALENLRFDPEPAAVLPHVLDAVHGRRVDERRSAACVLGELADALDPLLTACELESEPVTHGRLLLSVGEHGGERARSFLAARLQRGHHGESSWAALALGLLAGESDDEGARAALREAQAQAGRSERDALLLAAGLAHDERAQGLLIDALDKGPSDRTRMFAAVALGLIGSQAGHDALRTAIGEVHCAFSRSGMALALALYGEDGDVALLTRLLRDERRPESLRELALALGLENAPGTPAALLAVLDQDPPSAVRAAALDALGLALDDTPVLAEQVLARASNHELWPGWVRSLVQHPL